MQLISRSIFILMFAAITVAAEKPSEPQSNRLRPVELFDLEIASDPQISPNGDQIVFVRAFSDIMKDRYRSDLWIVNHDGSELRALTSGNTSNTSPRWSPDGKRLVYISSSEGSAQLYVRWMDSGQVAKVTRVQKAPRDMEWSPDGLSHG